MSTKDLSRTIIEGGRHGSNTDDRRMSHRFERASQKLFLSEVSKDPELSDELSITKREHVYKSFADRLGGVKRWLDKQVGRPWNDVHSEIVKKFDTRTTAGRHVVYDHILTSVSTGPDYKYGQIYDPNETTSRYQHDLYVDDNGILQIKTYVPREREVRFDTVKIAHWLNGRSVGKVGDKLFWFVPVGKSKKNSANNQRDQKQWKCQWGNYTESGYYFYSHRHHPIRWVYLTEENVYKTDSLGRDIYQDDADGNKVRILIGTQKKWKTSYGPPCLKQHHKLNHQELAFWETLPEFYQNIVLQTSPTYPKALKSKY